MERLDEALIRPGRVDMPVKFGDATANQMERLWDRFYADIDHDGQGKRRFMARARELDLFDRTSTAALHGLFLYNKGDMVGAISMLEGLSNSSGLTAQRKL